MDAVEAGYEQDVIHEARRETAPCTEHGDFDGTVEISGQTDRGIGGFCVCGMSCRCNLFPHVFFSGNDSVFSE